jgi:hypothetical protein
MSRIEPTAEVFERERTVLECIQKNPDLHHNALLKLIVPAFMAKTTFEKTRNSLLEKNIITVRIQGNMKFYVPVSDYESKLLQHFERITNTSFHNLKTTIKKRYVDYSHKDIDEKIHLSNLLLRNLLQVDLGFTLLDSIKNPKKTLYKDEHLEIQELIYHVFELIHNDKNCDIVYPSIVGNIGNLLSTDFLES